MSEKTPRKNTVDDGLQKTIQKWGGGGWKGQGRESMGERRLADFLATPMSHRRLGPGVMHPSGSAWKRPK